MNGIMGILLNLFLWFNVLILAYGEETPSCIIELECQECVPDNMPLVTSHRAVNGSVTALNRERLVFTCFGGKFITYPLKSEVAVICEGGRYRVVHDDSVRHLLELGCQENIYEDVLHQVDFCGSPSQGRSYQMQERGHVRHLAALCFDPDRAIVLRSHATSRPHNALPFRSHEEHSAPLSLLGNFNQMFDTKTRADAQKLYSDEASMNRRLRELLRHDKYNIAGQSLVSADVLSRHYFKDQNMRVADFVSNKVAVWKSVAQGNLRHVHNDVTNVIKSTPSALEVFAGTHDVLSIRSNDNKTELFLKPGRFPVPKYIWTVVLDPRTERAIALITLNDPFIAVSEIREKVFCESVCNKIPWLRELRRNRNYETPLYGLVFCCNVHDFANKVQELPREIIHPVPYANEGLLVEVSV